MAVAIKIRVRNMTFKLCMSRSRRVMWKNKILRSSTKDKQICFPTNYTAPRLRSILFQANLFSWSTHEANSNRFGGTPGNLLLTRCRVIRPPAGNATSLRGEDKCRKKNVRKKVKIFSSHLSHYWRCLAK